MTKMKSQIAGAFVLLLGTTITLAESPPVSRTVLVNLSDAVAYDLGKAYQMGHNCRREL